MEGPGLRSCSRCGAEGSIWEPWAWRWPMCWPDSQLLECAFLPSLLWASRPNCPHARVLGTCGSQCRCLFNTLQVSASAGSVVDSGVGGGGKTPCPALGELWVGQSEKWRIYRALSLGPPLWDLHAATKTQHSQKMKIIISVTVTVTVQSTCSEPPALLKPAPSLNRPQPPVGWCCFPRVFRGGSQCHTRGRGCR